MEPPVSFFPTTSWTLVHLIQSKDQRGSDIALERLCTAYRRALYHYARASGLDPHDAEDAVQDFFFQVLGQNALATLQKEKGRLRGWMIRSFNNRLNNRRAQRSTHKRGGSAVHVDWQFAIAELEFSRQQRGLDASVACDLALAAGLWEQTLARLDADPKVQKRPELYAVLRPHLLHGWPKSGPSQAEVARGFGITINALRVRLANLSEKARCLFADIAAETLDPLIPEEEVRHLWDLLM